MIDSKDLRVGNIIEGHNGLFVVGSIEKDNDYGYRLHHKDNYLRFDNMGSCKPIKLTPEILEQIGFIRNVAYSYYELIDGSCFILNNDLTICDIHFYVKCEYLHDLQNAYKVLKNKELPIDINTLKI